MSKSNSWTNLVTEFCKRKVLIDPFGIRLNVPVPVILAIVLVIIGSSLIRYWRYQGQWNTLVSEQYGYTLEYPANWFMNVYGDRGSRGSVYLRSSFGHFLTSAGVNVHEQPMENRELEQVATWGEEIINRLGGYNWSDLEEVEIGQGNYPALVRTYTRNDFFGRHLSFKVFYIATEEHAFAFEFSAYAWRYDREIALFEHMLNSFQLTEEEE